MNEVFRFMGSFNLVVYARSLNNARKYVRNQAISSVKHRTLKYVGKGHPNDSRVWVGAVADKPHAPSWITDEVKIPEPYYINIDGIFCKRK